jgi:tRNA pseudouridine55 synthase
MNGIVLIDKVGGMTSRDVVTGVERVLKLPRAGHLGTLDPMATGVLPICVGKATKIAQYLPSSPKEYTGEIRFGFSTSTYDREGVPAGPDVGFEGSEEAIIRIMQELSGSVEQIPPPFSAKKVGGVRSYKLARRGRPVENAPVRVEVNAFELTGFEPPTARFRVLCSAGTYVRSLVHDLGQRLGCGAHLTSLRRLRSGSFDIVGAVPLDRLSRADVIPIEKLLPDWTSIEVSEIEEHQVGHGNPVRWEGPPGLVRILNKTGEFLAIAEVESGWAHPRVVLTSKALMTAKMTTGELESEA